MFLYLDALQKIKLTKSYSIVEIGANQVVSIDSQILVPNVPSEDKLQISKTFLENLRSLYKIHNFKVDMKLFPMYAQILLFTTKYLDLNELAVIEKKLSRKKFVYNLMMLDVNCWSFYYILGIRVSKEA